MTAKDRKQQFIDSEAALNQQEAAAIIGCRARDLSDYIAICGCCKEFREKE